jgi:hypothetical protein
MEVGLQPDWYFTPQFALISNFDVALLWGRFRDKKKEDYFSQILVPGINYHRSFKNNFSKMQTIIDLMLGFRWDETWACGRYRTALDLGWEQHIWLNFVNMVKQNSPITAPGLGGGGTFTSQVLSYVENQGDLIFGGLTVRARFDF